MNPFLVSLPTNRFILYVEESGQITRGAKKGLVSDPGQPWRQLRRSLYHPNGGDRAIR